MIYRLLFLLLLLPALTLQARTIRAVLEPLQRTLITSEISSSVKKVNRRMGETFNEGDDLILLNDVVFLANLMRARAAVSKAEADFEAAKQLWQDRVISHSDYREAQAEEATARSELALALKSYNAAFIKAPYDGKVVGLFVKQYERVEAGQELIEILDDHILVAKLLIPEYYFDQLKVGGDLNLYILEIQAVVPAKIVRIGAVLDPVSSLFKVEAEIDNSAGKLRAGMEGTLEVIDPGKEPVEAPQLPIPEKAKE